MSFTSASSTTAPQRSILIIKAKYHSIAATEKFLTQRGWNLQVVDDSIGAGLQLVGNFHPQYVFISTAVIEDDFKILYSALKKSFKVILFDQRLDAHAIQVIREIEPTYALQGEISGPSVERMILHIQTQQAENLQPYDSARMDIDRMANATEYALDRYCDRYEDPKNPLNHAKSFHYFSVHTGQLSGYFVVATSGIPDKQLLQNVHDGIAKYMERTGQFFNSGEIKEIELREVQFEGLALSCGEFFQKSSHKEDEIAIAFFRRSGTELKIEVSPLQADWVSTEITNIVSGERLDFDIYVYLPKNDRFVLYKRAGDPMDDKQQSGLRANGVTSVHLKREAIPLIEGYQARTYINGLIFRFSEDLTEASRISG